MSHSKWIKSSWTISIVTAFFSLLLTMSYDYFKEKPILTTIWVILKWIGSFIWSILNFDLKVWWIILAVLLLSTVIYLINRYKNEDPFEPDFYSFREGTFKKWKWSWDWDYSNSQRAWIISEMKAHCPNCDTPMIDSSNIFGFKFDCPRCEFTSRDNQCDDRQKIERIILDDIERKKNKPESKQYNK